MTNEVDMKPKDGVNSSDQFEGGTPGEQVGDSGLLDLLVVLSKGKRILMLLMMLGMLLAAGIAVLMPATYTATAVILPPQQQSSTAAALLGQLGGFAGLAGQSLGIKNPSDLFVGILSSRTVADSMVAEFSLETAYRVRRRSDARSKLIKRTRINPAKFSMIQISVDDRDPARAAALANGYVDHLQELNSKLAVTEAAQRRLFFELQLEATKKQLAEAELSFRQMQQEKGVIQVNSQIEAVVRSIAQMRAELSLRDVNLQRLKAGATSENPEVVRQEVEIKALRDQLRRMESKTPEKRDGDSLMPAALVPDIGLEYARRLRDVRYHEALFELLSTQFEAAKIDEARESPLIQVVDRAVPPDRKSAPSITGYAAGGMVLGGLLGIALVVILHQIRDPRNRAKIIRLKESLKEV